MSKNRLLTIGLALISLQAPALSQSGPCSTSRQGILSASGAALSLDEASHSSTHDFVRIKEPGLQTDAPLAWSVGPAGTPDYTVQSMFDDPAVASAVEFSAISTGASTIPEPDDGYPVLGDRWMNVTVSFTQNSVGTPGSWLRKRTDGCLEGSSTQEPGADLYGYYYDNAATGISTLLLGQSLIEQRTEDLMYEDDENVDGLDWALGIYANGGGNPPQGAIFRRTSAFYFALSSDCIGDVYSAAGSSFAVDTSGQSQAANEHTVYKLDWTGSEWDGPFVEFDLSQGSAFSWFYTPGDAIDALAFDDAEKIAVFSLVQTAPSNPTTRPQLLIYSHTQSTCDELRNYAGAPVFTELGGAPRDDVNAVCIVEPELDPNEPEQGLSAFLGTPRGDYIPPVTGASSVPMGLSVTLDLDQGSGPGVCIVQASGWGPYDPSGGTIHLFASGDQSSTPVNWTHVQTLVRVPSQDVCEWPPFTVTPGSGGGEFISFFALCQTPSGLVPSFVSQSLVP